MKSPPVGVDRSIEEREGTAGWGRADGSPLTSPPPVCDYTGTMRTPLLSLLLAGVALLLALAAPPPEVEGLPRVILEINRNESVRGWVESEDEHLIVIREGDGETVKSYIKARLQRIVRLVDAEPGTPIVVLLRDGTHHEGELVEDAWDHVSLRVAGLPTRFPRERVDRVLERPTVEELLRQLKSTITPEMTKRRLDLARWLIDRDRYDLAAEELRSLVRDEPDEVDARRLLRVCEAQLAMRADRLERLEGATSRPEEETAAGPVTQAELLPRELISEEDVNIIRVYEIDFRRPPRLEIEPDTIREVIRAYATNPAIPASSEERTALFRAEPVEIARLMMETLRAREFYPRIQVLSEPHALNLFRRRVHNAWLIPNCANASCHGGVKAGRFFLHRRNHRDERVRYTNFLILERLELDPEWPLINYNEPMMSLIVQHALPRNEARKPHPDVRGWRPVFTRSNPRLLEETLAWIEAMYPVRPDYPVEYEPPDLSAGPAAPAFPRDPADRSPR